MDKPHYIEDITQELSRFRADFNEHRVEDKEWKTEHEAADLSAFKEIRDAILKSTEAQNEFNVQVQALRADLAPSRWFLDGNKGFSQIPKTIWIMLALIAMLVVFGARATLAFLISLVK